MGEILASTGDINEPAAPTIERLLAAAGSSAIVAGAAAVWYFDPKTAGFFPVCPLLSLTGLACPGCGLTRGFHALFHGDVLGALDFNALIPFFTLLILAGLITMISYAIRGRRASVNLIHPNALWVFFIILLVFGVARNLPWYPFSVLYP